MTTFDSQKSVNAHWATSMHQNVPYLEKLCEVCKQLNFPHEFADIVGSQLLGLEGAVPTTHIGGRVPSIDEVVEFLTLAYNQMTDFADLIIVFLDDFQWIDSLTWKVIRVLCENGKNIMFMGAMGSRETQALRRMSSVTSWHGQMQSRRGIVEVNLGPLDIGEVRALIAKVLEYDAKMIDESMCSDIYQRTGGLPIYVVELLEGIKRNNTVEVDDESGLLRWTPEAQGEQQRIGSNSVVAVELPFLNRLDSLDLSIRKVLQTCAILGMSFSLSDIVRVHPEIDELMIKTALNAAVDELILVEDIEDEDEDDISLWSGDEAKAERIATIGYDWDSEDDRFFQFSHAMWRKSVLDTMLKEQKIRLHRTIAEAIEKEQVLVLESSDIGRLLTLFDHWKSCANFGKAAPLALAVGVRLEEWDLAPQSLDLYRDTLEMCYESAGSNENGGGGSEAGQLCRDDFELWLPASAPPATVEFILRLHIRIAKCHSNLGEEEQCATMFEDAYKIMTTSPKAARLNHELVLPIVSGLCSIVIQRSSSDNGLLLSKSDLIESFVDEARVRDEPVHLSRALAMKACFFAQLGDFESAVRTHEDLVGVYDPQNVSRRIREEYGKDFAAQSFADSIAWYSVVGDLPSAVKKCEVVVTELLPLFDLRDVDTVMGMVFPAIMVLKSVGRATDAETILFNSVINPYHDLSGAASSSLWVKLFNPLAYLLEIIKVEEEEECGRFFDSQMLLEMEEWVMDGEKSVFHNSELQLKGYILIGEICWRLARIRSVAGHDFMPILERGRIVLTRVGYNRYEDKSETYLIRSAREMLDSLNELAAGSSPSSSLKSKAAARSRANNNNNANRYNNNITSSSSSVRGSFRLGLNGSSVGSVGSSDKDDSMGISSSRGCCVLL